MKRVLLSLPLLLIGAPDLLSQCRQRVAAPTISPVSQQYTGDSIKVTLRTNCDHSEIFYTLNGSNPAPTTPGVYRCTSVCTLRLTGTVTVKARANGARSGCPRWQDHDVATATFTLKPPAVPSLSPGAPRTSDEPIEVSMSAEAGAEIRYTINGGDPGTNSTRYTGPVRLASWGEQTIRARAFRNGVGSGVTVGQYTLVPPVSQVWISRASRYNDDAGLEPFGPNIFRFFPDLPWPGYDPRAGNSLGSFAVAAEVSPPRPNVRVYFQAVDVDDRESHPQVDGNGSAGGDNIGDGAVPVSLRWQNGIASAMTNAQGVAAVTFHTSLSPGDNYRFVATTTSQYLYAGQNPGNPELFSDSRGHRVPNRSVALSPQVEIWRRVFVEVDGMQSVRDNTVTGTVEAISSDGKRINIGKNFSQTRAYSVENRFRGGRVTLSRSGRSLEVPVVANTARSSGDDTITLSTAVGREWVGARYALEDDDYKDGLGDAKTLPGLDAQKLETTFRRAFHPASILPIVVSSRFNTRRDVKFDLNYDDLNEGVMEEYHESFDISSLPTFNYWPVYLLVAFQATKQLSADPDPDLTKPGDSYFLGKATRRRGSGAALFSATIREYHRNPLVPVADQQTNAEGTGFVDIALHEIGHLFGCEHVISGTDRSEMIMTHDNVWFSSPLWKQQDRRAFGPACMAQIRRTRTIPQ